MDDLPRERLIEDLQWLLEQSPEPVWGYDEPPPIGVHLSPLPDAGHLLLRKQTLGISRRYITAILRELRKEPTP